VHQKKKPQKPQTKVKRIREEMQTTLENRKKATIDFPIIILKRNNGVKEGGALGLRM
jgi:hypothetical protein